MQKIFFLIFLLALSFPLQATQIFYDSFESGTARSEWSSNKSVDYGANFSYFLGRYSNSAVTLTLTNIALNSLVTLNFDLYIIDSWDGNYTGHNDHFRVLLGGTVLRDDLFSSFDASYQTYTPRTGDVVRTELGFGAGGWVDSKYFNYNGGFSFLNTSSTTVTFTFEGYGLQTVSDESWGIDNVSVNVVIPEPATLGYLLLSLTVFMLYRSKKN